MQTFIHLCPKQSCLELFELQVVQINLKDHLEQLHCVPKHFQSKSKEILKNHQRLKTNEKKGHLGK